MSANAVDQSTPTGPAGGSLSGTYPNPGIANAQVGTAQIAVPLALQGTASNPVAGAGTTGDTNNRIELRADGTIAFGTGSATPDCRISRGSAGNLNVQTGGGAAGSLRANAGLRISTAANGKMGSAPLTAGTVTVANTSVTGSSVIFLTNAVAGGTLGILSVGTVTAGTSFVINSSNAADTSTVNFLIMEP